MEPTRAAVYLRVSSKDGRQDEANQEPDCVKLCRQRGWEPIFYRERESGAKVRPEWLKVIEAARTGDVAAVVFWSVDRVGRTRVQVMSDLWNLARFQVAIVSCRERIVDIPRADATTSPLLVIVREQAIGWLTFMAEDERRKIVERTHAGLARARASGKRLGRPPADPGKLRHAVALVLQDGLTPGNAGRATGLPRSTVRDGVRAALAKNGTTA